MRSQPPARRFAQNVALALLSVVVSLGLVEIGLRLFWSDFYLKFRPELPTGNRRFHPERGWSLVPSIRVTQGDTEFTVTQTHNAAGFRGPEIAPQPSPQRPRVLVLGDSMTYGYGVEDADTFSAVLQQLEPELEVINAGVPGYSGVEELLLLRADGMRLAPDLVILGFFWNDVMGAAESGYARFELDAGQLRLVPPSPATPEHPIFQNERRRLQRRVSFSYRMLSWSYVYRFASDRLKLLHLLIDDWWERAQVVPGAESADAASGWQLSFALIREMRSKAEQGGADFLLLSIPDQVQIEQDVSVVGAKHYLRDVPRRLREFAQAENIEFLDLEPALRAARERDGVPYYYHFDRHWNAMGHRRAAETLRDALRSSGWIAAQTAAALPRVQKSSAMPR